jgi:pimeloyl-ACP methyl ester carboxylesterase
VDECETFTVDVAGTTVFGCRGGLAGPAVLLLHGFPEPPLMWRDVARGLAAEGRFVCVDVRGSGATIGFWPWSLLAQPAPLPERLIGGTPDAVIADALDRWGSASSSFPAKVREAYVEALSDAAHVHAICEEYRAAATIDRDHDRADRAAGHRIECPVLVLWSAGSALDNWYDEHGGPLGIWRRWAHDVTGSAVEGGHFFPEEHPQTTALHLQTFLAATAG